MPPKKPSSGDRKDTDSNNDSSSSTVRLTLAERTLRIDALHNRVRPHVVFRSDLEEVLELAGWDLDAAHQVFEAAHTSAVEQIRRGEEAAVSTGGNVNNTSHPAPAPAAGGAASTRHHALPRSVEGVSFNINYRDNTEQERHEAVRLLLAILMSYLNDGEDLEITVEDAILTLQITNFDVELAVSALHTFRAETQAAIVAEFGHLRGHAATQADRDERLARLLGLTSRPDYHSHVVFLEEHDWDYAAAVAAWYKYGMLPVRDPKDKPRTKKSGIGRRKNSKLEYLPMPSEEEALAGVDYASASSGSSEASQSADPANTGAAGVESLPSEGSTGTGSGSDKASDTTKAATTATKSKDRLKQEKRLPGFVINLDRSPAVLGVPDEGKFLVEYFQKGRYRTRRYQGTAYRWPQFEQEQIMSKPLFDWNKQADITRLNKWLSQNLSRITKKTTKEASSKLLPAERDFLESLYDERWQDLQRARPNVDANSLLPPWLTTKLRQEWEDRFNAEFEGKVLEEGKGKRRRRAITGLLKGAQLDKHLFSKFNLPKADGVSSMTVMRRRRSKKRSPSRSPVEKREAKKVKAVEEDESGSAEEAGHRDELGDGDDGEWEDEQGGNTGSGSEAGDDQ